jgi:hypothetical protein
MVKRKQIPFIKCGRRVLFIAAELEDWFFCIRRRSMLLQTAGKNRA